MRLADTSLPNSRRVAAIRNPRHRRAGTFILIVLLLVTAGLHPAMAGGVPLRAGADVEKPEKVEHVQPLYPEEARAAGVEAAVLVGFTVDVGGRVTEPMVLSGHRLLDEAALVAVRQWRYRPTEVDGEAVPVKMVETVPFWLGTATRPEGWPFGSSGRGEKWITWPVGEKPKLKLLEHSSAELPAARRVYRGTIKSLSKKPLRNVFAAAFSRDSLSAPQKATAQELGNLEPGQERRFELKPEGHVVEVAFGHTVDDETQPLPTLRQIKSMTRVLPSKSIRHDRSQECLGSRHKAGAAADGLWMPDQSDEGGSTAATGDNRPPKARKITRPEYSKRAFDAGVEGTVLVELIIDTAGYVDCARVLTSMPGTGLDAEALKTTYEWRFEPAVKNGRPVPTVAHAPVNFRIY